MKPSIHAAITLAILLGCGHANADCSETPPTRHCSSVAARSGVDSFNTSNGRPVTDDHGTQIKSRSGPLAPRIRTLDIVGKTRFSVSWQIGVFSCVEYVVSYCTN